MTKDIKQIPIPISRKCNSYLAKYLLDNPSIAEKLKIKVITKQDLEENKLNGMAATTISIDDYERH